VDASRRVPVLIVSGFLGSGKTTLVRQLLTHAQTTGVRVAVVSNEFGELGIDEALLGGGEETFVELAGGCICCRLSDELVDTLQALRERVDPERIVIETSGVALPFETQLNLYRPPVSAWVGDEASVVVVNAEQLLHGESLDGTFVQQVESADMLVLHKVDLVPPDSLPDLEAALTGLNPDAPIVRASYGGVDPELLFPAGPLTNAAAARRAGGAADAAPSHTHDAFTSEELHVPDGWTPAEVEAWLLPRRGLRTKGFVRTTDGIRIVQGVGRRLELTPPGDLAIDERLLGRVVVIRRDTHSSHGCHM
jgi:G3E family GTPase